MLTGANSPLCALRALSEGLGRVEQSMKRPKELEALGGDVWTQLGPLAFHHTTPRHHLCPPHCQLPLVACEIGVP